MLAPIRSLSGRTVRLLRSIEWSGPLLVRLAVGLAFALNGWGKLHNLEGITELFASLGIPAAGLQAAMVSTIEFAGGLLLIAGLGTRIAAALLIGVMTVATLTAQLPQAEHLWDLAGTIEVTYLVVFIWLAVAGAGRVSLDHLLARDRPEPDVGVAA